MQFEVCQGGGCAESNLVSISAVEWENVTQIFKIKAKNAAEEKRNKLAKRLAFLRKLWAKKMAQRLIWQAHLITVKRLANMDCNDEAINTTSLYALIAI